MITSFRRGKKFTGEIAGKGGRHRISGTIEDVNQWSKRRVSRFMGVWGTMLIPVEAIGMRRITLGMIEEREDLDLGKPSLPSFHWTTIDDIVSTPIMIECIHEVSIFGIVKIDFYFVAEAPTNTAWPPWGFPANILGLESGRLFGSLPAA